MSGGSLKWWERRIEEEGNQPRTRYKILEYYSAPTDPEMCNGTYLVAFLIILGIGIREESTGFILEMVF